VLLELGLAVLALPSLLGGRCAQKLRAERFQFRLIVDSK
jgi:hypothetical protein